MSRNAEKTLISIGDIFFGDVLTDRPGDVLVIHPGTFWFGDVLTGHHTKVNVDLYSASS